MNDIKDQIVKARGRLNKANDQSQRNELEKEKEEIKKIGNR